MECTSSNPPLWIRKEARNMSLLLSSQGSPQLSPFNQVVSAVVPRYGWINLKGKSAVWPRASSADRQKNVVCQGKDCQSCFRLAKSFSCANGSRNNPLFSSWKDFRYSAHSDRSEVENCCRSPVSS